MLDLDPDLDQNPYQMNTVPKNTGRNFIAKA
jgi:hypothetical protein